MMKGREVWGGGKEGIWREKERRKRAKKTDRYVDMNV
jgi:hypothetical protein